MRLMVAAGAALLIGACSSASPETSPRPAPVRPPAHAPPPEDLCGASEWRHLVGQPRTAIPTPVRPELQRVACVSCPITMDYNPRRLNFFFDADTGVIREIRCG